MFQRRDTALPGVLVIEPQVFRDARGFFLESYHQAQFTLLGVSDLFVQDNHSGSRRGTLRGLHFQTPHPQAKLCRVIRGEVVDVAVDIRRGSPTFGKWTSTTLSAENQRQIYIPRGFAHGFAVLSEFAEFFYKCSDYYDPASEHGVHWSDPQLAIDWGIADPIVSAKDSRYPRLAELSTDLLPVFGNL